MSPNIKEGTVFTLTATPETYLHNRPYESQEVSVNQSNISNVFVILGFLFVRSLLKVISPISKALLRANRFLVERGAV